MNIQLTLKDFIVKEFMHERDQNLLASDTPLIEEGIIDSMGLMKLVNFIENTFGIEINEEDLDIENFRAVDAIATFIQKKSSC